MLLNGFNCFFRLSSDYYYYILVQEGDFSQANGQGHCDLPLTLTLCISCCMSVCVSRTSWSSAMVGPRSIGHVSTSCEVVLMPAWGGVLLVPLGPNDPEVKLDASSSDPYLNLQTGGKSKEIYYNSLQCVQIKSRQTYLIMEIIQQRKRLYQFSY